MSISIQQAVCSLSLLACLTLPAFAQEPATGDTKPATPAPASANTEKPKTLQLGQRATGSITLLDIDGKPQNAHDLIGKVTVVNFYSIECPVQRAWDKRLATIQKDFEKDGVVFLHIDSNVSEIGAEPQQADGDEKPYAEIREHLKEHELPFRVLVDHGNVVADFFDARTTPHVYVFGKDGKLVYKGLVDDDQKNRNADNRHDYLRDTLGKLVKGEKVEPFSTKETGCSIKRVEAKPAGDAAQKGLQHLGGDRGGEKKEGAHGG